MLIPRLRSFLSTVALYIYQCYVNWAPYVKSVMIWMVQRRERVGKWRGILVLWVRNSGQCILRIAMTVLEADYAQKFHNINAELLKKQPSISMFIGQQQPRNSTHALPT